jgi:hypothetical protein
LWQKKTESVSVTFGLRLINYYEFSLLTNLTTQRYATICSWQSYVQPIGFAQTNLLYEKIPQGGTHYETDSDHTFSSLSAIERQGN